MFLVMLLIVILGVGIALLFSSSSPPSSGSVYNDPLFFQAPADMGGARGRSGLHRIPHAAFQVFRRWMPFIVFGTLAVVLLPFLPRLGASVLGSQRWITLFGLSFQPSELVS